MHGAKRHRPEFHLSLLSGSGHCREPLGLHGQRWSEVLHKETEVPFSVSRGPVSQTCRWKKETQTTHGCTWPRTPRRVQYHPEGHMGHGNPKGSQPFRGENRHKSQHKSMTPISGCSSMHKGSQNRPPIICKGGEQADKSPLGRSEGQALCTAVKTTCAVARSPKGNEGLTSLATLEGLLKETAPKALKLPQGCRYQKTSGLM